MDDKTAFQKLTTQVEELTRRMDAQLGQGVTQDAIKPGTIKNRHIEKSLLNKNILFDNSATGDMIYSTSTLQSARLPIGTPGQYLGVSGGVPAWQNYILYRTSTQVQATNTTNETTVFTYSVPASTLGTTKILRISAIGTYLNNSGSSQTITIRLKYGATTIATIARGFGTGSTLWSTRVMGYIFANGATNSQKGLLRVEDLASGASVSTDSGYGTASEDSTAAKTLLITAQHAAANGSLTFSCEAGFLELL